MPSIPGVTSSTVSPGRTSSRALASVQALAADVQLAPPEARTPANSLFDAAPAAAGRVAADRPLRKRQAPARAMPDRRGPPPAFLCASLESCRIRLPPSLAYGQRQGTANLPHRRPGRAGGPRSVAASTPVASDPDRGWRPWSLGAQVRCHHPMTCAPSRWRRWSEDDAWGRCRNAGPDRRRLPEDNVRSGRGVAGPHRPGTSPVTSRPGPPCRRSAPCPTERQARRCRRGRAYQEIPGLDP